LFHPEHTVENTWLVMGILLAGIIIESFSLRVAFKEISHLNTDHLPLPRFLRESRHSEILIIFAEDTCAVVGLLLAMGGTMLSHVTGNPIYDALSGVLIGVLLCLAALFLARELYSLLIGESATEKDQMLIRQAFDRGPVSRLINLKTVHLGPDDLLVTAKVELADLTVSMATDLINTIEQDIRASLPQYKIYIYIEQDKLCRLSPMPAAYVSREKSIYLQPVTHPDLVVGREVVLLVEILQPHAVTLRDAIHALASLHT
jgi:divalent metal cation (Fe/Co/Zn/Cd) transporter